MLGDARWLYFIIAAFALGVGVRSFFEVGLPEVAFVALVGLVVAWGGRGVARGNPTPALFCGLAIFALSLGMARMEIATWSESVPFFEEKLDGKVTLEGLINREPDERAVTTHLYIKTDHGLVLAMTPKGEEWSYGDRVSVVGKLAKPESFETDLGREFNYRGYLLAKGVAYTISFAEVELLENNAGNPALALILESKRAFISKLEGLIPEPEAGLSLGLLLGVKRAMGDSLEESFRRAGIIHIVVLSGYNLALVSGFIVLVLGALFGRRFSAVIGIVGILAFAVMVGLSATVVRASIMAVLLLIMGLTGRVYLVLRGLFVAGALMIIWNPYSLAFDVGFQLSFLATLGLIVVSPHLEERLRMVPNKWISVREFLVATLATQLFVLPILLYQVGEFSVVAVLVNVLVLPMVPAAMLLSFLTGLAAFVFPPLASVLALLTYVSLTYIVHLAEWFSSLPLAAFVVPAFPFWLVPVGYALIVWCLWRLDREPDPLKDWTIVEVEEKT